MCLLVVDLEYYVGLPDTEHHRAARMRGHDMALIFDILFAPMELVITLLSYLRTPVFKEFTAVSRWFKQPHLIILLNMGHLCVTCP